MVIKTSGGWTSANQGAECLYLILSTMRDGDKSALDFFQSDEVGDTDGDGMNEILDGWGQPIQFLRWPAGYAEQPGPDGAWGVKGVDDDGNGVTDTDLNEAGWPGSDDIVPKTPQTRNWQKAPDPFDPAKVDPRWRVPGLLSYPYAIFPLVFSSGRDKSLDIDVGSVAYANTASTTSVPNIPPSDPYFSTNPGGFPEIGQIADVDKDGSIYGYVNNITNHDLKNQ